MVKQVAIWLAYYLMITACYSAIGQNIIPLPNQVKITEEKLRVTPVVTIGSADHEFALLIPATKKIAEDYFGIRISQTRNKALVELLRNPDIEKEEAYKLTIASTGISIEAGSAQGCFYGLQSLLQLLDGLPPGEMLQGAIIEDEPIYPWRGLMLDESRHFFGVSEVKQILDMMAIHKLNKFHWHLTDVPGWRIEIKKYPLLTTVGGTGNHTNPDAPASYYTQEQITEIVRYAAERFIEVIPEIDMPGHATAAVKAYPEFSGGGSARYPEFTFNPGKDATYTFLTDILREVAGLFPTNYIHIGGDEVHFGNEKWAVLPEVKKLMNENSLRDLVAVEHYFLDRMADSIRSIGRHLIGWDEVVTAGMKPDNTLVMWWRHDKPALLKEALDNKYEVVLCPRIPLYFDFVQHESHQSGRKWAGQFALVESVYAFPSEKFTGGVSPFATGIKGIQANVWTEEIHSRERLHFMMYPRLSALAEAAWTHENRKDFTGFTNRMKGMFSLYGRKNIGFYDFRNPENAIEVPGPKK